MKNTGYIAVAHLFKENHEMITDLRCFLNYFIATLDNEELIDKTSALWKFDEFFKTAKVSLQSFSSFFIGILKKPDAKNEE